MTEQVTICMSCFEKKSSRISLGGYILKCNLQADKNEPLDEEPVSLVPSKPFGVNIFICTV